MLNRLSRETSPYLLAHQSNPVDWWPWGQDALEEAQRTNRPILLSVGYAACHWCHVMAHESFADAETAKLMNALFVNIKVDREERPDLDQVYMAALQHLGQRGGWPLTMFLTPRGEPFWGGTYFPKEGGNGRPSFTDVLGNVARIFREQPENVERNRSLLMQRLHTVARGAGQGFGLADLDRIASDLLAMIDPVHGGLVGSPKFPHMPPLELLWRAGLRSGDPRFLAAVDLTLTRLCEGGLYDQIGGGFSRYAVDEQWRVPHFEKMLYDNAQILEYLALAAQRTGSATLRLAAEQTVAWLVREMTTAGGAFCASLDADADGDEGGYYLWSAQEIADVLGADDAALFARAYGVTREGNFEGRNVLYVNDSAALSADERTRLALSREKLFSARRLRPDPARDDKVLADWNGLMIAALVNAGIALDEAAWIELAATAFQRVVALMTREARFGHSWRRGKLLLPGLASDYAAMIRAALALYEARGDAFYLQCACDWQEALERHHADAQTGGYTLTPDDAGDIVLRIATVGDDALPNVNALAAQNLLRLAFFTDDDAFRKRAQALFDGLLPIVAADPLRSCALLNALDFSLRGTQIVVVGEGGVANALQAAALALPAFERMVLRAADAQALPPTHSARAKIGMAGAAAFLCAGEQCSLPLTSAAELIRQYQLQAATPPQQSVGCDATSPPRAARVG